MGHAAARIADDDPPFVCDHMRRLYWLLSEESGGLCYRAPEAMAEIICRRPRLCAEYTPITACLILSMAEEDLERFRPGALWAVGRLGPLAAGHVEQLTPAITAALEHPDAQTRGMAVWCLGQLGREKVLADRPALLEDDGPVEFYEDREILALTVGELVRRSLS